MLLRADRISKRYGSNDVLREVSLSVQPGEILGLIGPNGAGKTTLFECLAGLLPADSGQLHRPAEMFYVPDGIRPWSDQRVGWTLAFFASLHGRDPDERNRIAASLQLDPLAKSRVNTLSKGEAKRLLLALGLLTRSPLLLLDEPFDGLDFRQTRQAMQVLRDTTPRTLFLSIHQLGDAARICSRLILLSGGRVMAEGTLARLRQIAGLPHGGLEEVFLALT